MSHLVDGIDVVVGEADFDFTNKIYPTQIVEAQFVVGAVGDIPPGKPLSGARLGFAEAG